MKNDKKKTEPISIRIDADLKVEFFDLMEKQDKCFSKWLRNVMILELEKDKENNQGK